MHMIFRESHGLEDNENPVDLAQTPADLVVLSFSDSDLGAFAAGWRRAKSNGAPLPSLRLANLAALKHPLSVDTYIEQTLEGAKGILIRLIGGRPYWPYGLQQVEFLARERGLALAVLPADGRVDPSLDAASTLPISTLRRLSELCETGGEVAAQAALAQMALAAGLYAGPVRGTKTLPPVGAWTPEQGACCPFAARDLEPGKPVIAVTFYRAYMTAADLEPVEALFKSFQRRGFEVVGYFAPSLKAPEAARWLARQIEGLKPAAIVNATSFSGKGEDGTSPLDAAGAPVFQVSLATSREQAWAESDRGLSPADLAMHVVLPEVDGRIFAGVASFKEPSKRDPELEFSRFVHRAREERIEALAERVESWVRLGLKPAGEKQAAIVLSTYPGKDWNLAHAVGMDALASTAAILEDLAAEGFAVGPGGALEEALGRETIAWPLEDYRAALADLSPSLRADLEQSWGAPEEDPACRDGALHFKAVRRGAVLVALQPERGSAERREDEYHDTCRTPRHGYVAFYLWLRKALKVDALIHVGAHGTLEWLPGKSVALSADCWPDALIGPLPVIYPFIVNDPGEAAQAKRRIGAVTLGHIPPPLKQGGTPERLFHLEALLDEFSNADGLDPKRRERLREAIREEARAVGVEADLDLSDDTPSSEAILLIDRFVCDIKDAQFGDGLHIFGRTPAVRGEIGGEIDGAASAEQERAALIKALCGRQVAPGPSGSPYRGRRDVLPTGRNLFTTDPRAVPTKAAYAQGVRLAEELLRRHRQDEGDYPKNLIVDLWGSATMRTAGEEFAMALYLLGVEPIWDPGSERVSGFDILPIAVLDRPRIDVTLRVSGLFRDIFPTLLSLFNQVVAALGEREDGAEWNPYEAGDKGYRVFGPEPGSYGLGMNAALEDYSEEGRRAAGEAWLAASAWALDGAGAVKDRAGIDALVAKADSFVHLQDLPETDILLASDYAAHQGGFAAAKQAMGGEARHYHLDNTDPHRPRARSLKEEIARVVRGRASNPRWIAGMRRHGFRGASEIAATLDHLASFAQLTGMVEPELLDLYHEATLGDDEVLAFLQENNPQALQAMRDRFAALYDAGLWKTRRNSVLANLEQAS